MCTIPDYNSKKSITNYRQANMTFRGDNETKLVHED